MLSIPSRRHSGRDGQWHSQEEVVQGDCHVEVLNPRGQTLPKHVTCVETVRFFAEAYPTYTTIIESLSL